MDGALTKDGYVITIMIAAMVQMKVNFVIPNIKHARPKNLHVKILNASEINIDVMVKTIAAIDQMS